MAKRERSAKVNEAAVTVEPAVLDASIVDENLVAEAVKWIREKVAETIYRGMNDIGDYLLDRFFGGDGERVRSRAPNKNASFRSLVERCETAELPLHRSALHNAVSVAVMRRSLPAGATAFKQLPPSHQVTLLPLRDPGKVEKVAQRAVSKGLSVRALKEVVTGEVAKTVPYNEQRGRTGKPIILKTLDRSLKVFTLESGRRSFTKAQLAELSEEQAIGAMKTAQVLLASLQNLIEKLGASL